MLLRTSIILLVASVALFAKEDDPTENALQRLEEAKAIELNDDAIESLKEISDNVDASLHMHPGVETKSEETEIDSTSQEAISARAEADAEMAAFTDSLSADMPLKKLTLDMSSAVIPTASRRIAAPYGIRTYRMHRGVDLGLCHGEDRTIVAAFTGTVVKVRNQGRRKGYGKYVILDHGNGLTTLYAHLASWKVKVGDTLQAGDTIGVGGNTGRSFGAHLHFEMRYEGIYLDPATIFNFEQGTFWNVVEELDPDKLMVTEKGFDKELSKHRYYKVRSGDCLGKIAHRYGISIQRLKQLNNLKSNMIRPGQVLRCS